MIFLRRGSFAGPLFFLHRKICRFYDEVLRRPNKKKEELNERFKEHVIAKAVIGRRIKCYTYGSIRANRTYSTWIWSITAELLMAWKKDLLQVLLLFS